MKKRETQQREFVFFHIHPLTLETRIHGSIKNVVTELIRRDADSARIPRFVKRRDTFVSFGI